MITFEGKAGIKATILCDSISEAGVRLITYELEKPRIVLAEENTHRMLSKNSASSRAIPFTKMKEQLTGRPVRFGQANSGMQDKGEDHNELVNGYTPEEWWRLAQLSATRFSEEFYEAGYHKQIYNRLTEPFQMMKTILTGTELENFFWLRNHSAADPTIQELARCMWEAREKSKPQLLKAGEWHLPYLDSYYSKSEGKRLYGEEVILTDAGMSNIGWEAYPLEDAIKVSCARCAAVSYRNEDYGVEKSREVYERLVGDERKHASAFEHVATPMTEKKEVFLSYILYAEEGCVNIPFYPETWEEGVTHMDKNRQLWSGNFRGWVQYRKLIPGENYVKS